jgi:PilZ domain-containing protein
MIGFCTNGRGLSQVQEPPLPDPKRQDVAGEAEKRVKAKFGIPVGFLGAGLHFTGDMVNLSKTGILVQCSQDLEPGTVGRLGFPVEGRTARFLVRASRRVPGVGIAFHFHQMSPHDRSLLQLLISRLASPTSKDSLEN